MEQMKYEIVYLEEKKAAGLAARTNNHAPDMGMVIGGLWERFYQKGVYTSIAAKADGKALGIYADYEGDEHGDYTVMVGCAVEAADQPEGIEIRTIPAGPYAKFIVKGHMVKAVSDFWMQLWNMDLPRSYVCDFEEYQDDGMENAEIHIYIGLDACCKE